MGQGSDVGAARAGEEQEVAVEARARTTMALKLAASLDRCLRNCGLAGSADSGSGDAVGARA